MIWEADDCLGDTGDRLSHFWKVILACQSFLMRRLNRPGIQNLPEVKRSPISHRPVIILSFGGLSPWNRGLVMRLTTIPVREREYPPKGTRISSWPTGTSVTSPVDP